jgi:hypothetical protein
MKFILSFFITIYFIISLVIILNTSLNNYLNEYTKFKLLIASKKSVSIYENQINLINNLKVNREKYISIKSIFFNYWNEFLEICKRCNGKTIPLDVFDK